MAETSTQHEIEDWIRNIWMPAKFHQDFSQKKLPISSGGIFEFDAVSDDEMIIANISTSSSTTARGKPGIGKIQKIRSDAFFLLLLPHETRKLLIFTEADMADFWKKEKERGRLPHNIEIYPVDLSENLRRKLQSSRKAASDEVSP